MKTIIAGSRSCDDIKHIENAIRNSGFNVTEVISGTANGADKLGEQWATLNWIPIQRFPADWEKHGKRAGYIRNDRMANFADQVIVIWDGRSKGSESMINIAKRKGLPIYVHNFKPKMINDDNFKGTIRRSVPCVY